MKHSNGTIPDMIKGLCCLLLFSGSLSAAPSQYSKLWGRTGEHWNPKSRLPDFSYAGYHRGEKPLPQRKAEVTLESFGVIGDGKADDTAAFQRAIEAAKGKVLAIPPGRYKITDFLVVSESGTVLKGSGPDDSVLFFPIPLNEIKPNWGATTTGQRTSNYAWSGGFIRVAGSFSNKELARVTVQAKRGDRSLLVSNCERFKVGDEVRLLMRDTAENSLAKHVYAGDPGPLENLKGRSSESFVCRITKINPSVSRIEFDRPLRIDVRLEWNPRLLSANSSVEEVGIEGLGFEYPNTPYKGHFTELGYNAVAMSGVRNCWLRDLQVHNADSGFFVGGINVTIQNILISSERTIERSRRASGHHGITLSGQDNLLTDFEFRTRFMHDVTMTRGSAGNVISAGRGVDLAFDHHRYGPHSNLFTDIDLGLGTRMFQSGGGAKLGRHSAAYETFWNIRAQQPQVWPKGWGPDLMNFIGVTSTAESTTDLNGRWFEVIPGLEPSNLHQAQLTRRMGKRP